MTMPPANINKAKVLVVGDSGVGKTSLVHLLAHNKVLTKASWTIGCSVEVKIHEYKEGSPQHCPFFVELWDVGGNNSYQGARHVFYKPLHGVIFVHDMANRKSHAKLRNWVMEVLLAQDNISSSSVLGSSDEYSKYNKLIATNKIPILFVGTHLDQLASMGEQRLPHSTSVSNNFSDMEVFVSCIDQKSVAPGSGNAVYLSRFFDEVCDRVMRQSTNHHPTSSSAKHRLVKASVY